MAITSKLSTSDSKLLFMKLGVSSITSISLVQTLTISQSIGGVPDNKTSKLGLVISKFFNMTLGGSGTNILQNTLILSQQVVPLRIRFFSRSQSLTISQSNSETLVHTANSPLTLAQAIVLDVQRNLNTTTHLTFNQSAIAQIVFNRTLSNALVFKNEHQIPNGTGGFIDVSNLLYTKGGSFCCGFGPISTTVFVAPTRSIVLPNPEFNDTQALVAGVKIIRTITGGTYSYAKNSSNRKLKYKFHITQRKAFEVRQFLLDFLATRVMLYNWQGEIWSGFFLSDPAEIVSILHGDACIGDLYEVELDFQGIRIN